MLAEDFTLAKKEVRLGLFAVRLDEINIETLKKMRKLFPRHEYNRMVGRMNAYLHRNKKRNYIQRLLEENARLKLENRRLQKLVAQGCDGKHELGENRDEKTGNPI